MEAFENGFDQRVEFTVENIARFYKIISEPDKPFWYAQRICGKNGGTLPVLYNVKQAKVYKVKQLK
jgi:hypothetical protein